MNDEKNVEELGYARILLDDISACSQLYGTEEYRTAVERLRHDVLDLKDGPKLRKIVEDFYNGKWNQMIQNQLTEWKKKNPYSAEDVNEIQIEEEQLRKDAYPILCDFIKQLLASNGCIKNYYGGGQ